MTEIFDSDGYGNLLDSDGNIQYIFDSDGWMMYDSSGDLVFAPVEAGADSAEPVAADSSDDQLISEEVIKYYYSHRGNLYGPEPTKENTIAHIDSAIGLGFNVEIDVWNINGTMVLGHDEPTDSDVLSNFVTDSFFVNRQMKLLVHCKNAEAILHMKGLDIQHGPAFNYFFHDSDAYNITSWGSIIAYPGKPCPMHPDIDPLVIAMKPELHNTDTTEFKGICSDYIVNYKNSSS